MAIYTAAIVGAGFSGTLLALHLLRQTGPSHIALIEREHPAGSGLAYATANPNHRLNVPAKGMSAFADEPDDFLRWLDERGQGGEPGAFVPRWLFGCYVRQRLGEAVRTAPGRLDLVRGDVRGVRWNEAGASLHLACGRVLPARQVALATGNQPPHPLPGADAAFLASPYYRGDPWAASALAGLDPDAPVLLVGTGLTMVDTVVSLLDAGHRGPIQAISRHGLLPRPHCPAAAAPFVAAADYPASFVGLARRLRRDARDSAARGLPWQAVMDGVRPHIPEIWCAASEADRRRFLRHGRVWWDIHRHRIAPPVAARIDRACAQGQLRVDAGHLRALTAAADGADIVYAPRGGTRTLHQRVARVINCTAPASDVTQDDGPLGSLLAQGLVRPDPLRLGLDVTRAGEVVGSDGAVTPGLFALGPLTRGTWWDVTSVPGIRLACCELAELMARRGAAA